MPTRLRLTPASHTPPLGYREIDESTTEVKRFQPSIHLLLCSCVLYFSVIQSLNNHFSCINIYLSNTPLLADPSVHTSPLWSKPFRQMCHFQWSSHSIFPECHGNQTLVWCPPSEWCFEMDTNCRCNYMIGSWS